MAVKLNHRNHAAAILGCSRNTVSEIKELCRQQGMTWDDIQDMTDGGLYDILYPKKFKRTTNCVPVDYAYVHSELRKTGVTMKLLRLFQIPFPKEVQRTGQSLTMQ